MSTSPSFHENLLRSVIICALTEDREDRRRSRRPVLSRSRRDAASRSRGDCTRSGIAAATTVSR